MPTMSVQLRSIPDTQAAIGWADGHTIVVDDVPDGKARRHRATSAYNGGQLLGLAIGGVLHANSTCTSVAHEYGACALRLSAGGRHRHLRGKSLLLAYAG